MSDAPPPPFCLTLLYTLEPLTSHVQPPIYSLPGERNGFATGGRGGGSGKNDAYFTDDHFSPRDVVPIFPCAARLAAPVYKLILRYNECVRSIMVEEVKNQPFRLSFNTQILPLSLSSDTPSLSSDSPSLLTLSFPPFQQTDSLSSNR